MNGGFDNGLDDWTVIGPGTASVIDDPANFLSGRLRFFLWRHLPRVDSEAHFGPFLSDLRVGEVCCECVEAELALLLRFIVTMIAIVFEKCKGIWLF